MTDAGNLAVTNPPPNHRFMAWAGLCFFSIVTLASHLSATRDTSRDTDDWFIVVVASVSSVCSFATLMAYFTMHQSFAGGALEAILAILTGLFWICGMPLIMDPARNIAVSKGNSGNIVMTEEGTVVIENRLEFTFIRNANIYFFSWASTICIVYVCGRLAKDFIKRRRQARALNKSIQIFAPETNMWYLLTVSALVMLVDSIEIYMAFSCSGDSTEPDLCMRTKYAVSLGSIGAGIGFVCSVLATIGKLNLYLELAVAILLFGLYIAGVALITFNDGPGTSLGNLYFATWLGALVTLAMVGSTYQDTVRSFQDQGVVPEVEVESKPEEPVEFPDDIEWGKSEEEEEIVVVKEETSPSPPEAAKTEAEVKPENEPKIDEDIEVGKAYTTDELAQSEAKHQALEEEAEMEDDNAKAENDKEAPPVEGNQDEFVEADNTKETPPVKGNQERNAGDDTKNEEKPEVDIKAAGKTTADDEIISSKDDSSLTKEKE